jgi:hypothetical protein
MRFMLLLKGNEISETGVMPSDKIIEAMGKYNEELIKAGVLLEGEGLRPRKQGAVVKFANNQRTVVDGPYTEAKEVIAGYWMLQVNSKEEAVEWAKRVPLHVDDQFGTEGEIEVRQVFELSDFPQDNEAIRKEAEWRAQNQRGPSGS